MGGTAGRTTLNGEGLQHEDGHSHLVASTVPNCISYDPAYIYEIAVIVQDGMRRMFQEQEDVFYYVTLMNENYEHPPMPKGAEDGIRRGIYKLREHKGKKGQPKVQLFGSGTILRQVETAQGILEKYGVSADVWSVTSYNELRRDAQACERWNRLHPDSKPRLPYITQVMERRLGGDVPAIHEDPAGRDRQVGAQASLASARRLRAQRQPRPHCAGSSKWTARTSRARSAVPAGAEW